MKQFKACNRIDLLKLEKLKISSVYDCTRSLAIKYCYNNKMHGNIKSAMYLDIFYLRSHVEVA